MGPQFPPDGNGTAPLPRIPAAGKRPGYVLKGIGLVAVAVVSGLLWWLVRHDPAAPVIAQGPPKEFAFAIAQGPAVSTNCAANSTGEVRKFFTEHPCQRLTRALYNTAYGNYPVLVSVVVVSTAGSGEAQQLKALADRDGTGNINDLLKDGTARVPGAPKKLGQGKYASRLTGSQVVIVLSEFFDEHSDDAVLTRVDGEALDLATQLG